MTQTRALTPGTIVGVTMMGPARFLRMGEDGQAVISYLYGLTVGEEWSLSPTYLSPRMSGYALSLLSPALLAEYIAQGAPVAPRHTAPREGTSNGRHALYPGTVAVRPFGWRTGAGAFVAEHRVTRADTAPHTATGYVTRHDIPEWTEQDYPTGYVMAVDMVFRETAGAVSL